MRTQDRAPTTEPPLPDRGRERIGPYLLLQKIGEGGMGEVWIAEQREPVRRTVAVKVIKIGMDSRQVVARFQAERQALAVMDHPAIAKVLDAGTTDLGRPYFVMEYVKGEPITDYCDRHRLSTDDRLELFARVCEGVQHAHQKGIIHRDLKPPNVLVVLQDGRPVPKIIDFGIAKATAHHLTEQTVFTELGGLVGTPEYMSPEQAEMTGLDIDTRTDIYSLGVLLYQLLTGTLPFEPKTLRAKALDEIRRTIREEDPPRPSARVTQLGAVCTQVARNRLTEPTRLASRLRGDLDWITMKALEKDRTRRYETASTFAGDVQRHLQHEPVVAGPPGGAYRARKFVRRHRFGVGAAAVLLLLLFAFGLAMGMQAQRIARERDRANREAERASREAAAAQQVADFLAGLFRVTDPEEARGRVLTAREILDKGAARIDAELTRDPALQARLLFTMGDVYRNLGVLDRSEQLLERSVALRSRALGHEHPETLRASSLLGTVYDLEGKTAQAEQTLSATLAAQRRIAGDDDPSTLKTLSNLANVYDSEGRYDAALPLMRDVFERRRRVLGANHVDTLGSQYNLAVGLYRRQAFEQSERLLQDAVASFIRVAGGDHPKTLMAKELLAAIHIDARRTRDAARILGEVYEARRRVLGPDHMDTLASQLGLANVATLEGRYADAEGLFRRTLAVQERTLGPNHSDTIATRVSLATMLSAAGRKESAEAAFRDALARMRQTLGPDHPDTSNCLLGLAEIEAGRGRRDAALALIRESVRVNPSSRRQILENGAFASFRGLPDLDTLVATK